MDQCSQLSIEFDRLGLTDLLEGISMAGDRFYLVEHLFASGKVNQEYRKWCPRAPGGAAGAPGMLRVRPIFSMCSVEIGNSPSCAHDVSQVWCPVPAAPL